MPPSLTEILRSAVGSGGSFLLSRLHRSPSAHLHVVEPHRGRKNHLQGEPKHQGKEIGIQDSCHWAPGTTLAMAREMSRLTDSPLPESGPGEKRALVFRGGKGWRGNLALGSQGRKRLAEGEAVEGHGSGHGRAAVPPGAWGSGPGQGIILDQQEKQMQWFPPTSQPPRTGILSVPLRMPRRLSPAVPSCPRPDGSVLKRDPRLRRSCPSTGPSQDLLSSLEKSLRKK